MHWRLRDKEILESKVCGWWWLPGRASGFGGGDFYLVDFHFKLWYLPIPMWNLRTEIDLRLDTKVNQYCTSRTIKRSTHKK